MWQFNANRLTKQSCGEHHATLNFPNGGAEETGTSSGSTDQHNAKAVRYIDLGLYNRCNEQSGEMTGKYLESDYEANRYSGGRFELNHVNVTNVTQLQTDPLTTNIETHRENGILAAQK
ncbi:hypothetical protein T265_04754 [Opisthorchis viverrini]|uniref:Uncharacterized protein n=1 Tax=Opisthorchis viverrini TaxID=6198 RepID=A0A074ZYP1_OPIVI|nr:hypothetical protein T265_04754 [Opisthorchis viverrini]KER28450.1 hypothetical protein T265_04754 [Opisthorchis viverrini]